MMFPRHFVERGIVTLWFLIISALPLAAQGVGAIGGTVMDATGAVLPGATVTLSSVQGTVGGNQITVTDGRGAYQFLRLVPATYAVRAELQGFRPVEQRNVVVNADVTARADIRLEIGTLEEGIIVTGGAPLLDTTTALKQTVITRQELEALPNRTDVWAIARVIPGVVINKIDVGGTEAFLQSTATVRGSSTENKFMIDGMDVSTPTGNGTTAVLYLDPYAFEETTFQVGTDSAENSNGGLTYNMITRTGTNQFHGGGMFNGTTPALARSRNYSPELRAQLLATVPARALAAKPDIEPHADIRLMTDAGAWLAGPVARDKLWFAGTWHDQRLDRYNLGSYDPDGTQVIDDNRMWTTSAKLSWQVTKSAQLSYFNNLQYKLIGHRGGGTFADSRARQYNPKYPVVNQLKFTSLVRAKMAVDATYNRLRSDDPIGPRPEVKPGDIATTDTTTQVSAVALPTYTALETSKDQFRSSVSWFAGAHDIKIGYEYVNTGRPVRIWSTSGLRANFANGVPTSVNTYLVAVTKEQGYKGADIPTSYAFREDTHGAYIQDKWILHRKLTLNLGLRYETSDSWQPATCRPETQFFAGACFEEITAPSFRDVSPRFNLVYDVNGDAKTALKVTANRYNQPISVSVIERLNPVTTVSDTRQWLAQSRCGAAGVFGCDRNGDLIPQLDEIGPTPGYVFPGVNALYPDDLKRPVSNEYTVELQRELPQGIVFSAGYVHRQTRRNIATSNTAAPPSSWIGPITVTEVTSGRTVQVWNRGTAASANLHSNSKDADTNYHGGDITLRKRMSDRWSMQGGASFGKVTAATRGGNRNDPNITSAFDSNVITEGDRPWSYRLSGVYELPYQLFLSGTWQFQAGPPETTIVLVTNQTIALAQGNQSVQVAPVGDVRFPNTATLDLNIRKVWRLGRQTLAPRLEIFNATNESTITAWVSQLGPTYHRPSGLQRGRLIKLELAYDF
jgi:hypothetical protein